MDESTVMTGNINTPPSEMDRSSREEISKDPVQLDNTINPLDIMDIYRLLLSTAWYTFFSSSHGTFAKIDHILGHKTHCHKFKRREIKSCLLSDHNGITREINKRKTGKLERTIINNFNSTHSWWVPVTWHVPKGKHHSCDLGALIPWLLWSPSVLIRFISKFLAK